MTYVFHPAAESEHLENVGYYELKRPGLGAIYLADFEQAIRKVCDFPGRFPVVNQTDISRVKMDKFPFHILFRNQSGIIQILAVAHLRRRPLYWLGRS